MTPHAAASNLPARERYFAMPVCPQCGDTLLAPEVSAHVSPHEVRHFWSCDACGHGFATAVDLHAYPRRARA